MEKGVCNPFAEDWSEDQGCAKGLKTPFSIFPLRSYPPTSSASKSSSETVAIFDTRSLAA